MIKKKKKVNIFSFSSLLNFSFYFSYLLCEKKLLLKDLFNENKKEHKILEKINF